MREKWCYQALSNYKRDNRILLLSRNRMSSLRTDTTHLGATARLVVVVLHRQSSRTFIEGEADGSVVLKRCRKRILIRENHRSEETYGMVCMYGYVLSCIPPRYQGVHNVHIVNRGTLVRTCYASDLSLSFGVIKFCDEGVGYSRAARLVIRSSQR